jgi:hypothetical protein
MMWIVTAAGLAAEICGRSDGRLRRPYATAFFQRCDEQVQRRVGARVRAQTCRVDGEPIAFVVDLPSRMVAALGDTDPPEAALLVVSRIAAEVAVAIATWLGDNASGVVVPAGNLRLIFEQIGPAVRCSGRLPVSNPEGP